MGYEIGRNGQNGLSGRNGLYGLICPYCPFSPLSPFCPFKINAAGEVHTSQAGHIVEDNKLAVRMSSDK